MIKKENINLPMFFESLGGADFLKKLSDDWIDYDLPIPEREERERQAKIVIEQIYFRGIPLKFEIND